MHSCMLGRSCRLRLTTLESREWRPGLLKEPPSPCMYTPRKEIEISLPGWKTTHSDLFLRQFWTANWRPARQIWCCQTDKNTPNPKSYALCSFLSKRRNKRSYLIRGPSFQRGIHATK